MVTDRNLIWFTINRHRLTYQDKDGGCGGKKTPFWHVLSATIYSFVMHTPTDLFLDSKLHGKMHVDIKHIHKKCRQKWRLLLIIITIFHKHCVVIYLFLHFIIFWNVYKHRCKKLFFLKCRFNLTCILSYVWVYLFQIYNQVVLGKCKTQPTFPNLCKCRVTSVSYRDDIFKVRRFHWDLKSDHWIQSPEC